MRLLVKDNWIELLLILIVFTNIFFHYAPVLPLVFGGIILSLTRLNSIGAFTLSSYALPILLGSVLSLVGVSGVGSIVKILLFIICLYEWLILKRIKLYHFKQGILPLIIVFVILFFSILITRGGNFAFTKLIQTIINGVCIYFSFSFLFSNLEKCNFTRLGLYLILYAYLMLMLSPLLNGGAGPMNFFDFGYLRNQNLYALGNDGHLIEYQHVGFFATLGCGIIFLNTIGKRLNVSFAIFALALCMVASLYSGARQFILISLAIILLWVMHGNKGITNFIYIGPILIIVVFLVVFLFSEGGLFSSVKDEGYLVASHRDQILLKGVSDFLDNPIIGVGYGRFVFFGEYGLYPHNLFVEILCELGLIGALALLLLVIKPLSYLLSNYKFCIYLLIILFLRSMVSGGMDSNVMLLSYILSTCSLKRINLNNFR